MLETDSGWRGSASWGRIRLLEPRRDAAERGDFRRGRRPSAPDAGEVAKNKFPAGRQHPCRAVRGCPSWLGSTAIMDDHGVWPSGHKTQEGHRLAALRTGRSPGNRQRFGGYQQHVYDGQGGGHQHFQPLEVDPLAGMGEAVVPDLLKAAGQHVLQEPPDERVGRDGHGAPAATAAIAIGERDTSQTIGPGFALDQPAVADGHAIDVGRQIAEGPLPVSHGLAVNHPGPVAEGLPGLVSQSTGGQAVQELGAIDGRSRLDRDEEVDAAGHPPLPGVADRSSRNDKMHVGMEVQGPSSGVQHPAESQIAGADVLGVAGQLTQSGRGGVEHGPVTLARMGACHAVEFPRQDVGGCLSAWRG